MKTTFTVVLASLALAATADAGGQIPGSALIYPIHTSQTAFGSTQTQYWTLLCVTNTDLAPVTSSSLGGTTNVMFEYVNVLPGALPTDPVQCVVVDRVEVLTPGDTFCVLTNYHNATPGAKGYAVVSAQDPSQFKVKWSHNRLVGSELVVNNLGLSYSLPAYVLGSPVVRHGATDVDGDEEMDFDGVEYEGLPDRLIIDSFIGDLSSTLTLINFTGGVNHNASVQFNIFNDNEFALSTTFWFNCWFSGPLTDISTVFDGFFLAQNTPNDPAEVDITGDGIGDIETGWAFIQGLDASSSVESIPNPALLGAITAGPQGPFVSGGHLLFESPNRSFNGDFLKFGTDDPEFPAPAPPIDPPPGGEGL